MALIDNVKDHFQSKIDGGLTEIKVPEWKSSVYYGAETAAQRDKYFSLISQNKFEGFVELLVARAVDVDGKPAFSRGDKAYLMRKADPDVITRVASEIFAGDEVELEDAEKN